jgi:hypothetical protein
VLKPAVVGRIVVSVTTSSASRLKRVIAGPFLVDAASAAARIVTDGTTTFVEVFVAAKGWVRDDGSSPVSVAFESPLASPERLAALGVPVE